MAISMFALMLTIGGGGGNELLDYVPTKIYWQIDGTPYTPQAMLAMLGDQKEIGDVSALLKDLDADRVKVREAAQKKLIAMGPAVLGHVRPLVKSNSPEVAARAQEIVRTLSAQAQHKDVRRLMAIRALGEMKHHAAAGALAKLTESKELFVGEFAREALAAIKGAKYARPTRATDQRIKDIYLLPKNCGVVGQIDLAAPRAKIEIDKIVAALARPPFKLTKNQLIDRAFKRGLLLVAAKVGNVRIDSATIGVSDDVGDDDTGFVVVIARGLYDAEKVKAAMRGLMAQSKRSRVRKVGQVELFLPDKQTAMIFPANDMAVLLGGPNEKALPVDAVLRTLATGKGTLHENKEMMALIAAAEKTAPMWAVMRVSKSYRKVPIFEPFGSAVLVGKRAGGVMSFALTASVQDPEKLKDVMKMIEDGLAEGRQEMNRAAARMPPMKPIADFIASIKVVEDGRQVRATAQLKADSPMGLMMPMLMFTTGLAPAPPAAPPPRAVRVKLKPVQVRPAPKK